MIAALPAAISCAATPIHFEALPQGGSLSGLPWVQGVPHRRGIFGMLFGYDGELGTSFALFTHGESPRGHSTKLLRIVRNRYAGGQIVLRGRELGGTATFRQWFGEVWDASAQPAKGHEYASIVNLPQAGCWRLDVKSGRARATFVVQAVDG